MLRKERNQVGKVVPTRSAVYRIAIPSLTWFVMIALGDCHHATEPPISGPDTTSHGVLWQFSRLGDGASNYLEDIAIINDSLAYAVGTMYLNDSTGNLDHILYNMAKWDGHTWSIQSLKYGGSPARMNFVFALNQNDIWFGMGFLLHWDGVSYKEVELPVFYGVRSNKMWGNSSGELYVVGDSGTIAYSPDHGQSWQKLLSGTTLDIHDIWGAVNPQSGSSEILAVAGNPYVSPERALLSISETKVTALDTTSFVGALRGVWFDAGKRYYVVGVGIYEKSSLDQSAWQKEPNSLTKKFVEGGRGSAWNDVFGVGDFGEVLHYNGQTWKSYLSETGLPGGLYYAVAYNGKLILAVGEDPPKAIVLTGRRF
jgi:hypothetical protein